MDTRVVKIKSWDRMAEEYGLDEDRDIIIENDYYFYKNMNYLCEKIVRLKYDKYEFLWKVDNYYIVNALIEEEYFPETHPEYFS